MHCRRKVFSLILFKIKSNNARTWNIQKNVLFSILFKGANIGINLLLVPLMLNYLDAERYGLWLTLSSIVGWVSLFDIGLGNGLRNKFAQAIAVKDDSLARTYVSTTFVLLSIIIGCVLVVFFAVNRFLDWERILNTSAESGYTLSLLAVVVFVFFALRFIFNLITSVFLADQKSALVDFIGMLGSLLSLGIVLLLMQLNERSLLYLGLALSVAPVLVLMGACFVAFSGRYAKHRPSFRFVDFSKSRDLVGLGFLFFIPQVCSLIVFATSNVIISQVFSPSEVAVYNIAFKYFSVVTLLFNIILSPCWSAYTEAFVKQDFPWLKNTMRKLVIVWGVFCIGTCVMVALAKPVYQLWVGDSVYVPFSLTVSMAVYVCVANWNNIFTYFINGISKIYIQVWLALIIGIAFVPLAVTISGRTGLAGIPLAMILVMIIGSCVVPLQAYKLISGKAKGIWNK